MLMMIDSGGGCGVDGGGGSSDNGGGDDDNDVYVNDDQQWWWWWWFYLHFYLHTCSLQHLFQQDALCSPADILEEKSPMRVCNTVQALLEVTRSQQELCYTEPTLNMITVNDC